MVYRVRVSKALVRPGVCDSANSASRAILLPKLLNQETSKRPCQPLATWLRVNQGSG
jgi:hypothetical protein